MVHLSISAELYAGRDWGLRGLWRSSEGNVTVFTYVGLRNILDFWLALQSSWQNGIQIQFMLNSKFTATSYRKVFGDESTFFGMTLDISTVG